ncbi:MAG: NlpC/P60 family N-terminal domain-containing protein, partial [Desulfovibrionaceae bacterium]
MLQQRTNILITCLALCLALSACTTKKVVPTRDGTLPTHMKMIKDLSVYPQDLMVYAKLSGEDRNLLSPAE